MKKQTWISISGLIWAAAGLLLLYKGLNYLAVDPTHAERATWLIGIAILVGFVKGRFVLAKTVRRISVRLDSLEEPIRFADAYPKSYWLILASMMAMGFFLRLVPLEVRGFIDVAIGSALLNGAMLYFRAARALKAS